MTFAGELLAMYAIYGIVTTLLILRYAIKDRVPIVVIAWLAPVIIPYSAARALSRGLVGQGDVPPCPEGLYDAELVVEREKQRMFGGKPMLPRISAAWSRAYALQLEKEAERVQGFARKMWSHARA